MGGLGKACVCCWILRAEIAQQTQSECPAAQDGCRHGTQVSAAALFTPDLLRLCDTTTTVSRTRRGIVGLSVFCLFSTKLSAGRHQTHTKNGHVFFVNIYFANAGRPTRLLTRKERGVRGQGTDNTWNELESLRLFARLHEKIESTIVALISRSVFYLWSRCTIPTKILTL